MITLFICNVEECANSGVLYRMENANPVAICGGCKAELIGTPEQKEEQNG